MPLFFWFNLFLETRAVVQKYFCSFFGSNEKCKICFRNLMTSSCCVRKRFFLWCSWSLWDGGPGSRSFGSPGPLVPPALGWKRNGTNSVQCPVRNMYYALSFMLCSNDIRKLESGYWNLNEGGMPISINGAYNNIGQWSKFEKSIQKLYATFWLTYW